METFNGSVLQNTPLLLRGTTNRVPLNLNRSQTSSAEELNALIEKFKKDGLGFRGQTYLFRQLAESPQVLVKILDTVTLTKNSQVLKIMTDFMDKAMTIIIPELRQAALSLAGTVSLPMQQARLIGDKKADPSQVLQLANTIPNEQGVLKTLISCLAYSMQIQNTCQVSRETQGTLQAKKQIVRALFESQAGFFLSDTLVTCFSSFKAGNASRNLGAHAEAFLAAVTGLFNGKKEDSPKPSQTASRSRNERSLNLEESPSFKSTKSTSSPKSPQEKKSPSQTSSGFYGLSRPPQSKYSPVSPPYSSSYSLNNSFDSREQSPFSTSSEPLFWDSPLPGRMQTPFSPGEFSPENSFSSPSPSSTKERKKSEKEASLNASPTNESASLDMHSFFEETLVSPSLSTKRPLVPLSSNPFSFEEESSPRLLSSRTSKKTTPQKSDSSPNPTSLPKLTLPQLTPEEFDFSSRTFPNSSMRITPSRPMVGSQNKVLGKSSEEDSIFASYNPQKPLHSSREFFEEENPVVTFMPPKQTTPPKKNDSSTTEEFGFASQTFPHTPSSPLPYMPMYDPENSSTPIFFPKPLNQTMGTPPQQKELFGSTTPFTPYRSSSPNEFSPLFSNESHYGEFYEEESLFSATPVLSSNKPVTSDPYVTPTQKKQWAKFSSTKSTVGSVMKGYLGRSTSSSEEEAPKKTSGFHTLTTGTSRSKPVPDVVQLGSFTYKVGEAADNGNCFYESVIKLVQKRYPTGTNLFGLDIKSTTDILTASSMIRSWTVNELKVGQSSAMQTGIGEVLKGQLKKGVNPFGEYISVTEDAAQLAREIEITNFLSDILDSVEKATDFKTSSPSDHWLFRYIRTMSKGKEVTTQDLLSWLKTSTREGQNEKPDILLRQLKENNIEVDKITIQLLKPYLDMFCHSLHGMTELRLKDALHKMKHTLKEKQQQLNLQVDTFIQSKGLRAYIDAIGDLATYADEWDLAVLTMLYENKHSESRLLIYEEDNGTSLIKHYVPDSEAPTGYHVVDCEENDITPSDILIHFDRDKKHFSPMFSQDAKATRRSSLFNSTGNSSEEEDESFTYGARSSAASKNLDFLLGNSTGISKSTGVLKPYEGKIDRDQVLTRFSSDLPPGLTNLLGSSCYLNSAIQLLYTLFGQSGADIQVIPKKAIEMWRQFLDSGQTRWNKNEKLLFDQYAIFQKYDGKSDSKETVSRYLNVHIALTNILYKMQVKEKITKEDIEEFDQSIEAIRNDVTYNNGQQDAVEVLNLCFECLNLPVLDIKTVQETTDRSYRSEKEDVSYYLSLPMGTIEDKTLQTLTEAYFHPDIMEDEHAIETGNGKKDGTKTNVLQSFPPFLPTHLKRFDYLDGGTKLHQEVDILTSPVTLTLSESGTKRFYFPKVIICQTGEYHAGHYITFANYDGIWYLYDDETVTTLGQDLSNPEAFQDGYETAYVKYDTLMDLIKQNAYFIMSFPDESAVFENPTLPNPTDTKEEKKESKTETEKKKKTEEKKKTKETKENSGAHGFSSTEYPMEEELDMSGIFGSSIIPTKKPAKKDTKSAQEKLYSGLTTKHGLQLIEQDLKTLDGKTLPGRLEGTVAVVNAASPSLVVGKRVNKTIHAIADEGQQKDSALAGLALQSAETTLGRKECRVGQAILTDSLSFKNKHVDYIIHAVGPDWSNKKPKENQRQQNLMDLSDCYYHALVRAKDKGVTNIVFCPDKEFGVLQKDAVPAQLAGIQKFFDEFPDYKIKIYINTADAPTRHYKDYL